MSKPKDDMKTQLEGIAPQVQKTTKYRNVFDFIEHGLEERGSKLGALRSIAGAIQFSLINTAEFIVREEDRKAANGNETPTIDERNAFDEWERGEESMAGIDREFGREQQLSPTERIKQSMHLYYGVINLIRQHEPNQYERPRGLIEALQNYTPRAAGLSESDLELIKSIEMEKGEFDGAALNARERRIEKMKEMRPRIIKVLEEHADTNPLLEVFEELPIHIQARFGCNAWKGVYYARKQLVSYLASNTKAIRERAGEVKQMQDDLVRIERWCNDFESEHGDVFAMLTEAGITVYGIDDAKQDVKDQQERRKASNTKQ